MNHCKPGKQQSWGSQVDTADKIFKITLKLKCFKLLLICFIHWTRKNLLHHDQFHLFWTDLSIPFGSAASRFNELLSFRHDFDCFPTACERVGLHVYVHVLPQASSHMAMQQQNTLNTNQCSGSALP